MDSLWTGFLGAVLKAIMALLMALLGGGLLGCSLFQPTGFPAEMTAALTVATEKIAEQGVLDKFTTNLRGHVKDPGIESYALVRVSGGVRIVGTDGDMIMETSGVGTMLPPETLLRIKETLQDPNIPQEVKDQMWQMLIWNRLQVEGDDGGVG